MKKIGTPRPPKKAGSIKFQYGRNEGELDYMVLFGDNTPRCDRALVMQMFTSSRIRIDPSKTQGVSFEKSMVEELESRGYDMSTLRFSIDKK